MKQNKNKIIFTIQNCYNYTSYPSDLLTNNINTTGTYSFNLKLKIYFITTTITTIIKRARHFNKS